MQLLNIFNTGGLTLGLTIVAILLIGIFGYQLVKGQKSGSKQQGDDGRTNYYKEPVPIYKNPFLWGIIIVIVLYVLALTQVASDYKGV